MKAGMVIAMTPTEVADLIHTEGFLQALRLELNRSDEFRRYLEDNTGECPLFIIDTLSEMISIIKEN